MVWENILPDKAQKKFPQCQPRWPSLENPYLKPAFWSWESGLQVTRVWNLWHRSLSFLLAFFSFEWNSFARHFLFFLMPMLPPFPLEMLLSSLWAEQLITGEVIRFQQVCQHAFHYWPQLQCQWFQEALPTHSVTEPETSNKQWRSKSKVMDPGMWVHPANGLSK